MKVFENLMRMIIMVPKRGFLGYSSCNIHDSIL